MEGGGREGAAMTNGQRKGRDEAVDSAVIKEEAPRVRASKLEGVYQANGAGCYTCCRQGGYQQ